MAHWIRVASVKDFEERPVHTVTYEDLDIVVFKIGQDFYAIVDQCTHMDARLSEGALEGHVIVCPLHGAKFDVRTGAVLSLPAASPVDTVPVKVEGNDVYVDVEDL